MGPIAAYGRPIGTRPFEPIANELRHLSFPAAWTGKAHHRHDEAEIVVAYHAETSPIREIMPTNRGRRPRHLGIDAPSSMVIAGRADTAYRSMADSAARCGCS